MKLMDYFMAIPAAGLFTFFVGGIIWLVIKWMLITGWPGVLLVLGSGWFFASIVYWWNKEFK